MPICVFDIHADGSTQVPSDIALTGPATYRWWHFDLSDPDLESWAKTHLPAIPAGALLEPETRPRCDRYEKGLILNLRGINRNEGEDADQMVSIRMWVEQNVIVTVRVRKVFAIDEIRKNVLAQAAPKSTTAFIEGMVQRLTARVQTEMTALRDLTESYEAELEDDAKPPPQELIVTRRQVIRLRRYLEPQRAALNKLAAIEPPQMPKSDGLRLREHANRTTIAVEELDALRERLVNVQDEYDLVIGRKQAHHGYILSIAAGVFLPLGFLTGLFGVNVGGMPGIENPIAFALLCVSMVGLAVLMFALMKLMRWL